MSNIIPLPTAQRRQVKQTCIGLDQIRAADRLPRHPATWEDHGGRKAREDARFTRSPEMLIVAAVLKVLSEPQKEKVRGYIGQLVDFDYAGAGPHAATALAIVENIS